MTADELRRRYAAGERDFRGARLGCADLCGAKLSHAKGIATRKVTGVFNKERSNARRTDRPPGRGCAVSGERDAEITDRQGVSNACCIPRHRREWRVVGCMSDNLRQLEGKRTIHM